MMINRIKQCGTALMAVVLVLLFFAPMTMQGQKSQDGNMAKAAPWLDKDAKNKLNEIEKWQQWEAGYKEAKIKLKNLNDSIQRLEKERQLRVKMRNSTREKLATMLQQTLNNQSYAQYDLKILLLQKSHYGTEEIEQQATALLICREAEKVLNDKYHKGNVEKAMKKVEMVRNTIPLEVINNISRRLNKYETMNTDLKNALTFADTMMNTLSPTATKNTKKQYLKQFFKEVEERIDTEMLNPKEYPYLYKVLMEALNAKMSDPNSDIQSFINKL